jgi:hypothetical protein
MRMRHCVAALVAAMVTVALAAGAEVRVGEWKEVSGRDGIVGYTRMTSLTDVEEVKAVGVVEAPVAVIEAVIRDVDAQPQYMFKCAEAAKVTLAGLAATDDISYVYNRTSMPWPVDDRYGIMKTELMVDAKTETLFVRARETAAAYPQAPSGAVRIPLVRFILIVTPLGQSKSQVHYQVVSDPGGSLPTFVVNLFSKSLGVETIAGLREMVKKEKYRTAKALVTTTPWTGIDYTRELDK